MLKVKGVYDGVRVILLEPVTLLPDTKVEVLIPDTNGEAERAAEYRQLAAAAKALQADYVTDGELTAFTALDSQDFLHAPG